MLRRMCRAMMAGIFIIEGVEAVREPIPAGGTTPALPGVAEADVPRTLRAAGAAQVAGGALLVLDIAPRTTSTMLAASLVPATAAGPRHVGEGQVTKAERRRLMLRNLALFGGLVITAMDTQGQPGLGWRAGHLVDVAGKEAEWRRREAELLAQLAKARASTVVADTRARTIVPAKQASKDARRALRVAHRLARATGRGLDTVTTGVGRTIGGVGRAAFGTARATGRGAAKGAKATGRRAADLVTA